MKLGRILILKTTIVFGLNFTSVYGAQDKKEKGNSSSKPTLQFDSNLVSKGKAVYGICAMCHNQAGKLDSPTATYKGTKALTGPKSSKELDNMDYIYNTIKAIKDANGKALPGKHADSKIMSIMIQSLNDEKILQVSNFIYSERQKTKK